MKVNTIQPVQKHPSHGEGFGKILKVSIPSTSLSLQDVRPERRSKYRTR